MRLATLLDALPHKTVSRRRDVAVRSIVHDSRLVQPGDIFVAIRETSGNDGHTYIPFAIAKGAVAIVQEDSKSRADGNGITTIQVPDSNYALAVLSAVRYDHPSTDLALIGVTGTNGKTTVAHMIESILLSGGNKTGFIGTTGYRANGRDLPGGHDHTTPYPDRLQSILRLISDEGVAFTVMEVSSHSLALNRVAPMSFQTAVFTNLTHDHLDYHRTVEAYLKAKLRLFDTYLDSGGIGVVNLDDPFGTRFLNACPASCLTYSKDNLADVTLMDSPNCRNGIMDVTVSVPSGKLEVSIPLTGCYNVSNALAAISVSISLGIPEHDIQTGLGKVVVPGRLERIDGGQPYNVLVDFAHTPDALESVLKTLRPVTEGCLIVVFGCGGGRDPRKRAIMGRIAANHSDRVIITSDNPRTEDPEAIIAAVVSGIDSDCEYAVLVNRQDAIAEAVASAGPGDTVLLAGKGDESYQVIGNEYISFDDRDVVRQILEGTYSGDETK
ncbi:MAG: UDP-N-acetylmuramoyl-L-alanyl-D-glutamate--2,6-diaminopimelate ligase [Gemmatimonadota bacterium]|nr:UDP-N-acetylmuramoyl-L-alanyl-D-glutamate--2,6-diaminopimelate ligase [Gemmatimonadota bacterium]